MRWTFCVVELLDRNAFKPPLVEIGFCVLGLQLFEEGRDEKASTPKDRGLSSRIAIGYASKKEEGLWAVSVELCVSEE